MKKTVFIIVIVAVLIVALNVVSSVVREKEVDTLKEVPVEKVSEPDEETGAACAQALSYMSFASGEDAEAFIMACLRGEHPEVIKRYRSTMEGTSSFMNEPILGEPLISVTEPSEGATVSFPLTVSGAARGFWFFEADAPVYVVDENGETIGGGYVRATENWMTEGFVPFEGTIELTQQPSSDKVRINFERANPSGIPDNAEVMTVIVFVE